MNSFDFEQETSLESCVIDYCGQEKFKKGLDRIRPFFDEFIGLSQKRVSKKTLKIVTLAGTNGKGQCAYQLTELLNRKGLKVATWTSPHIHSLRERIRVNGEMIDAKDFLESFEKVKLRKLPLSFYETGLWVFCDHVFKRLNLNVDVLIFEVGLGGRLDAVNLFDATVVGIPSIGRDHQEFLGEDLRSILQEKWGVVRGHQTVVTSLEQEFLRSHLKSLSVVPKTHFDLFDQHRLSLEMPYEQRNLYLAATLANVVVDNNVGALQSKEWSKLKNNPPYSGPARYQEMTRWDARFIFIGAHNLDGFRQMIKSLALKKSCGQLDIDEVVVSFSKRADKDIYSCLLGLQKASCLGRNIFVKAFDHCHSRAASAEQLSSIVQRLNNHGQHEASICDEQSLTSMHRELIFDSTWSKDFLKQLKGNVLVTGSYYFIAKFQRLIHYT